MIISIVPLFPCLTRHTAYMKIRQVDMNMKMTIEYEYENMTSFRRSQRSRNPSLAFYSSTARSYIQCIQALHLLFVFISLPNSTHSVSKRDYVYTSVGGSRGSHNSRDFSWEIQHRSFGQLQIRFSRI